MKVLYNISSEDFANTYLIGPDGPGDAIVIDPAEFNVGLLDLIESNNYYIRSVLITHEQGHHNKGLRTLLKIYAADIYASRSSIIEFPSRQITDGEFLNLNGLSIEVLSISGHSNDSLIYIANNFVFTGDSLSAGKLGSTQTPYAHALLKEGLEKKLLSRDKNYFLFHGHGPPSTLFSEKATNPELSA